MEKENRYYYPSFYELQEVLSEIIQGEDLKEFAQSKGIFMISTPQSELAKEMAYFYYEHEELEYLRDKAYTSNSTHAMSGFLVESNNSEFNLVEVYEKIIDQANFKPGICLDSLYEESYDNNVKFKGRLEYTKRRAGRIQFLQDEVNSFDFYFIPLENGLWQVEIDSSKSTDTKELTEILNKGLIKDSDEIIILDQDKMSSADSILFFDRLSSEGFPKEWIAKDIKQITIRKSKGEIDDSVDDDQIVTEEHLSGIKQAILEGKNLRNNKFVQESEKNGYRFTSMIYEFHSKKGLVLTVRTEFKSRPKVFEVTILNVESFFGSSVNSLKRVQYNLSKDQNYKYRSLFWNNAKKIYSEITGQNELL